MFKKILQIQGGQKVITLLKDARAAAFRKVYSVSFDPPVYKLRNLINR